MKLCLERMKLRGKRMNFCHERMKLRGKRMNVCHERMNLRGKPMNVCLKRMKLRGKRMDFCREIIGSTAQMMHHGVQFRRFARDLHGLQDVRRCTRESMSCPINNIDRILGMALHVSMLLSGLMVCGPASAQQWTDHVRGSWVADPAAHDKNNVVLVDGESVCDIVVADTENSAVKQAATFLAGDIEAISGKRPKIFEQAARSCFDRTIHHVRPIRTTRNGTTPSHPMRGKRMRSRRRRTKSFSPARIFAAPRSPHIR